jgi:hypothetical protein
MRQVPLPTCRNLSHLSHPRNRWGSFGTAMAKGRCLSGQKSFGHPFGQSHPSLAIPEPKERLTSPMAIPYLREGGLAMRWPSAHMAKGGEGREPGGLRESGA